MNRYKIHIYFIIILLATTGCIEGPEIISVNNARGVSVVAHSEHMHERPGRGGLAPLTKSAPLDVAPESFSVWAWTWMPSGSQGAPNWICGDTFTRDGDIWRNTGSPEQLPEGSIVRMFAMAPVAPEGVTGLPTPGVPAEPSFHYVCPASLEDQSDIVVAYTDPITPVPLVWDITFNHILAGLQIRTSSTTFPECTVSSLKFVGIAMEGSWSPSGWTDVSGDGTIVSDIGVTVPAGAAGLDMPLLTGNNTMMLIPQEFGPKSGLIVTFDEGGAMKRQTLSLSGIVLTEGYITVLRLSADGRFEKDWIEITGTTAEEEGIDFTFTSSSAFRWRATEKDDWRVAEQVSIVDGTSAELECDGFELVVTDTGSGYNVTCTDMSPYTDLSMFDYRGTPTALRNTANTYVVTSPGAYKIPMVYGNAIKNGATNVSSYTSSTSALNYQQMTKFVNHLGQQITAPVIEDNAGVVASRAGLLWQTSPDLVTGTHLRGEPGSSCRYVVFHVTSIPSDGGVAAVSAYDKNGDAVWTWIIWMTNEDLSPVTVRSFSNHEYEMMPFDLCQIKHDRHGYCAPVYQWGRKDALWNDTGQGLYTETGSFLTISSSYSSFNTPPKAVANPHIMFATFDGSSDSWCFPKSGHNWWDTGRTDPTTPRAHAVAIESIYDPCPAGWMVPPTDAFTGFTEEGMSYSSPCLLSIEKSPNGSRRIFRYRATADDETGILFFSAEGGIHITTAMTAKLASSIVDITRTYIYSSMYEIDYLSNTDNRYRAGHIRPILEGIDNVRVNEIYITGDVVDSRSEGFDNSGRSKFYWRPDAGSSYTAMKYTGKFGNVTALRKDWDGNLVMVTDPASSCSVTCTSSLLAEPLTLVATDDGTVDIKNNGYISVNGGAWQNTKNVSVSAGDIIRIKRDRSDISLTLTGGPYRVYGNIMSVVPNVTVPGSRLKTFFKDRPICDVSNLIIPSRMVGKDVYDSMFMNTAITEGPFILAECVRENGMRNMFHNCSSIEYICVPASYFDDSRCGNNFSNNVAASGIFVKHPDAYIVTGPDGIPEGWTVMTASGSGANFSTSFIFQQWRNAFTDIDVQ